MKKSLRYLRPYVKECILAPLFKMLEAAFELLVPVVVARLIDEGIGRRDEKLVFSCGALLLLLAVVGIVVAILAQYFAAKAATGFSTSLREALFSHIMGFSFTEWDRLGSATLITRLTADVNQAQNGVNMFLRLLLRSPFIVFGAWICAAFVDPRMSLIFAASIPVLFLIVGGIMALTIPKYRMVQERLDHVLVRTEESLSGARVIRAFGKETEVTEEFRQENDQLNLLQRAVGKISALTNPLTLVIVNGATVAILYAGGIKVQAGQLTQGQVVALVNYMAQILVELVKLANLVVTITRALASAQRIEALLSVTPSQELKEAPEDFRRDAAKVRFSDVSLRYTNAPEDTLSGISLSVAPGETVGIIGATASGKSSLVSMIPRFYDAAQGTVYVDGVDVKECDRTKLRKKVGMVFQQAVLFHGTVRENLLWGNEAATDEDLWEALKIAQADSFIREKTGGLDFVIEQKGRNLSGGQRQRLTIARALVRRPEILILDDATSALDYGTEAALRAAIRTLDPPPATFLVSQRIPSIRSCRQILVLEEGAAAGLGDHETLLKTCPVYREIYDSQFEAREGGAGNA